MLQEGHYKGKKAYHDRFITHISNARHAENMPNWPPHILADESRDFDREYMSTIGDSATAFDVEEYLAKRLEEAEEVSITLNRWYYEDYYTEVWFEAKAMKQQFRTYTEDIVLGPCGGDASIPYKYRGAARLSHCCKKYERPAVVLYFGDYDDKGQKIFNTLENHVLKWCDENADVTFQYCGLTRAQAEQYRIPENPEKLGQYQWEALDDDRAQEIITRALEPYLTEDAKALKKADETELEEELHDELIERYREKYG